MPRAIQYATVIIDTREQTPYSFSSQCRTIRRALPAGDYSIDGAEDHIAIERKSLPDYLASITADRPRFLRELQRLERYRGAIILVESDWQTIMFGKYDTSHVHPSAVIGTSIALTLDYRVPVIFAGTRETAQVYAERYLLRAATGNYLLHPLPADATRPAP